MQARNLATLTKAELIDTITALQARVAEYEPVEGKQFFDLSIDLFCIAGADGTLLRVNPAFSTTLGMPEETLVGQRALVFIHPEDHTATIAEVERVLGGGRAINFENRYRRADGAYRWISWVAQADEAGLIYAAGRDVTELKQAEQALRQSEARNRAIVDALPDLVFRMNGEGIYLDFRAPRIENLAVEPDQIIGRNIHELLPPDVAEKCMAYIQKALKLGRVEVFEYDIETLGQGGRRFEARVAPASSDEVLIVARDVTEQKKVAEALRESEDRIRTMLDTTVDGIITIDTRGRIESFNQAAERIFGYTVEEVVGQSINMLMPAPYREEHDEYMSSYLETGQAKIIGIGREVTGLRKNGKTFPMELAVSEVRTKGRLIFSGIIRDITKRRKLEQEILRISEQERRRIGQDLHDGLGQMLTGIGLISRNLAKKLKAAGEAGAEEVSEITELIKQADQQARTLARGLVPVEIESNGLGMALQRVCANAERLFSVKCVFEQTGNAVLQEQNVTFHLYRIAQEAVTNAVKHGKASHIKVTLVLGEDRCRLLVQDNGVGFPVALEEDRGMGVRIMHYRARIIGGTLDIWRGPEGGTTLTCTLNRAERLARGKEDDLEGGKPPHQDGMKRVSLNS